MPTVRKITLPRDKNADSQFIRIEIELIPGQGLNPGQIEKGASGLARALSLVDKRILRRLRTMPFNNG